MPRPQLRRTRPTIAAMVVAAALASAMTGCSSGGSDAADKATTTIAAATTTTELAAEPTDGCGTKPDVARTSNDRPGDVAQTFTSGGVERVYRLGVPKAYDPDVPAPLVFNLHGSGSNALQQSAYSDAAREGSKRGAIVVAPEGIKGRWELAGEGADDDFLIALLDDIEARYCVDQNRVHMMGMSLGSWKTAATACAHSDRFASIALVTVEVFPGTCDPIAAMAFHGTADSTVPYGPGADEGVTVSGSNARLPGALHNIDQWADNGGCDPKPAISKIGDDVELRRFDGCAVGVDVELYTVKGGGHTWSGSTVDINRPELTTHTIDATMLAFDWFEAHPHP